MVARDVALRALTSRARTRHELESLLARKGVPAGVIADVLDRYEELGLVNDTEFARSWVESRQRRRRLSGRALRHELARKGVTIEIAAEAVSQVSDEDEYAAALALGQSRAGRDAHLPLSTRRRRLAGVLARRGFSGSVVHRVLDDVWPGTEDVDSDLDV